MQFVLSNPANIWRVAPKVTGEKRKLFENRNSFAGMVLSINFAVLKKEKDRIPG